MRLMLILSLILLTSCSYHDSINIKNYFCDETNCFSLLEDLINDSNYSVHCALYEINDNLITFLKNQSKDVKIVTNGFFKPDFEIKGLKVKGLMHNKFCIFDGKTVFTGSFNPTHNFSYDNFLVIRNKEISSNYEKEFQELWLHSFKRTDNPRIKTENISIYTYFCPEDDCSSKLSRELDQAKKRIDFMCFSFTSSEIAIALEKANLRNVKVKGILDNAQVSDYSKYLFLKENGIDVIQDPKAQLFHFKTFIIDNTTIATGSFNPTKNAQLNNKENLMIIHDPELNKIYTNKFKELWKKFKKATFK